jgi:hypothetical protein
MNLRRKPILILWAVLIGCVIVGSLSPATSLVMVYVGRVRRSVRLLDPC